MPHVLLDRSLTDVNAQLEQFATNTFRPPQSVVNCRLLDQRHGLSGYLRFGCSRSRFVLPEKSKSLAMPPQQRLWLDNEQSVFPGLNRPRQKNQEHLVRFGTGRPFHLSPEDDKLLTQECVFCHEFRLASGKVCQRPQMERGGVRFCPGDEAVVERPKTKACQPRDEGENPMHSVRYPFVKMSESMLAILLFLWGIGKEQEA
jgi:hypothetical protein